MDLLKRAQFGNLKPQISSKFCMHGMRICVQKFQIVVPVCGLFTLSMKGCGCHSVPLFFRGKCSARDIWVRIYPISSPVVM